MLTAGNNIAFTIISYNKQVLQIKQDFLKCKKTYKLGMQQMLQKFAEANLDDIKYNRSKT